MKCVCVEKPRQIAVIEKDIPKVLENEVLIKVKASGICGTDVHITTGGYIAKYPVIIGHEFSGEVIEVGTNCKRIKKGDRVAVEPNIPCNNCYYCLSNNHHYCENMQVPGLTRPGGFAEYTSVNEVGVFNVGDLSYNSAAFMEPLSCILRSADRLNIESGAKLLIMGAGPIGVLQGKVSKIYGAGQIDYLEKNEYRASEVARYKWGKVYTKVEELTHHEYDAVIEATGVAYLASYAQKLLKPTGKVLVFGVPQKGSEIKIDAFDMFKNETSYIGTYTSKKDSIKAINCLSTRAIEVEDLVSDYISIEQVPEYIDRIEKGAEGLKKVLVNFD